MELAECALGKDPSQTLLTSNQLGRFERILGEAYFSLQEQDKSKQHLIDVCCPSLIIIAVIEVVRRGRRYESEAILFIVQGTCSGC